jgi:hypothetical protein
MASEGSQMRTIDRATRASALIALLILVLSISIAACSGGGSAAPLDAVGEAAANPEANPDDRSGAGEGQGFTDDGSGQPNPVGAADDAKIIRTGTMDLEVSDVPGAIRAGRDAIRSVGGYIGASSTSNRDDQPYAEITYRIPVDRWEDALDALRGLNGLTTKVVAEQTQAVDVTGQYVDLEARIRNLRASETALLAIAEKATRVSDILEVQAQITNVRGQIEQLEAQRSDLGDRTAYGTLAVTFQLPLVAAIEVQAQAWDPAAIFDEASASLVGLLQAMAGAGIWLLVVWVPILVVVSIVVALFAWLLRRFGVLERTMRAAPPIPGGD